MLRSVVCAVGAPESDALNPTAPKAIDGDGTIALIKESAATGVERFILISSLGTGKVGCTPSRVGPWRRVTQEDVCGVPGSQDA